MTARPALVVPVEVQARELDGKLLLSCVAAERGWNVILGCRARIGRRISGLPPRSVYLAKGLTPKSARVFDHLTQMGHGIVAWDEEALVYMSPEIYRRRRVSPACLEMSRALFAWGEDNAEIWRTTTGYHGQPLFTTGNPRVDMMRREIREYHREAADRLTGRFGRFVLVNSNFGGVNGYYPQMTRSRLQATGGPAAEVPPEKVGTREDPAMAAHRHAVFRAFLDMVPRLARAFPEHRIIVRPHPSESAKLWQSAARNSANVSVVFEGSVLPWLMAADAVIHNGCTTAVEAFLLERPAIAFEPATHAVYDIPLPNALSRRAATVPELIEAVGDVLAGGLARTPEQDALVRRFIAGTDGAWASQRVVDALETLLETGDLFPRFTLRGWIGGQFRSRVRAAEKKVKGLRGNNSQSPGYLRHIFPDLSAADLERRIARLRAATGRFGGFRVEARANGIFEIRAG